MTVKEFTVRQVFEALKENGFEHLRDSWTADDMSGSIIGGCILQQGAMNLGVLSSTDIDEYTAEGQEYGEQTTYGVFEEDEINVKTFEKEQKYNLVTQLDKWSVREGSKWDPNKIDPHVLSSRDRRRVGNVIMFWNDYVVRDSDEVTYFLPTYADVIAMAEEVLMPYMDRTILLVERTWSYKKVVNV